MSSTSVKNDRPRRRVFDRRIFALLAISATLAVGPSLLASSHNESARAATKLKATPNWPKSYAIRARAIYPVSKANSQPIPNGVMIVRDGKIVDVGRDLVIPADLRVFAYPDAVICPGFVSAANSIAGRRAGEKSISALFDAADVFDPYASYTQPFVARGTTTAHIDAGGHRLVSGRSAVVKLAGAAEDRVLKRDADLAINFGVFNPPDVVERPFAASSDVAIEPAIEQRPSTRLGQFLALEEQIAAIAEMKKPVRLKERGKFDAHLAAFARAWEAKLPLRIQVREALDIDAAIQFARKAERPAHLVALTQADRVATELASSGLPVVVRIERGYRSPEADIGGDPDALEPSETVAARVAAVSPPSKDSKNGNGRLLALAAMEGDAAEDLRMAAILAIRGGLTREAALAGITRNAAEIIGVGDRVGSLEAGKDADFLVLSADPLETTSQVLKTIVSGRVVYEAPASDAVVIRAGTIWVGNGSIINDGSVLIRDGKIAAVGQRVASPPSARVIDAGANGFVTPGFIDSNGHLGLFRDLTTVGPDMPIHKAIGAATREFLRVARSGVTTVLLSPYRAAPNGARIAAIKTWGDSRGELVTRELTGVKFSMRGKDPAVETENLKRSLDAAKAYEEKWKKYEKDLEEWKKTGQSKPKADDQVTESAKVDPVTGKWTYTLSGGPIPQPVSGDMTLKLVDGSKIEGRLSSPEDGEEAILAGRLDGDAITLEIDQETPFGKPTIKGRIDREDHIQASIAIATFSIDFEASRIDKGPVEFKVSRRKGKTKDGRPSPPKVDENLEPLRPLLAGKIPAVIDVDTAGQINAVLKLFVDEYKIPVVLLNAGEALDVVDALVQRKDNVGIVVPTAITQRRDRIYYTPAADLALAGLRVGFQSDAEEGARTLPLMALYAVQQGMGGDAALRALTSDAAKMFKLDDRLGSLEQGRDGDVLIFSGHPFDTGSRLERVIIAGSEVPNE